MSKLKKHYIEQANLRPVRLASLMRGNDVAGMEITFTESAPEMRDRFTWFCLTLGVVVTSIPLILLIEPITTIVWIVQWQNGSLTPDQKEMAYIVLGGSAACLIFWWLLTPPFRKKVRVLMWPASDECLIYHGGALADTATLTEVRGVSIEAHPSLADAQADHADKPDWGNRRKVNLLQQVETINLLVGPGMAVGKIEVASVMGRRRRRDLMAMRIRAALDMGWKACMAVREKNAGVMETPGTSPVPQRRRRSRIT